MRSLLDIDPKNGEFYSVLTRKNASFRILVQISENSFRLANLTSGHSSTGIGNLFDPKKLDKKKAKIHLEKEIKEVRNALKIMSGREEHLLKDILLSMRKFYKEHFS